MDLKEARPPYVRFHVTQSEDRKKSLESGHVVVKDTVFVKVTQIGSSDTYENNAQEWLAQIERDARADPPRIPYAWYEHWKQQLAAFEKSLTNEMVGVPLRSWPLALPSQIEAAASVSCFTVEDLAVLNEDGIAALGMGGRELKRKAELWLQTASDSGKVTMKMTTLEEEVKQLKERNESLESQVALQEAELKKLRPAAK